MDRAPVRQEDDSQISMIHLLNRRPATDAPILLYKFFRRIVYYPFDPFLTDDGPIRALPHEFEVLREFHVFSMLWTLQPGGPSLLESLM
jgi:hypothetical protein